MFVHVFILMIMIDSRPYYLMTDAVMREKHAGKTLLDHILHEFPFQNRRYIEFKIRKGLIQVNTENVNSDYVLKLDDYVSNLVHFHEHPVLDYPIDVIYEDDDYLVVNKPPSYVIYAHSSFRQNCLTFILKTEKGYHDLRPVHRLDRQTSGVCILAKVIK